MPAEATPIVTLTSDFGTRDHYVAVMKAALLRHCPHARLIDVTHQVLRHDIVCGSVTLERAVDGFPPGTVHLAVVDPGVGTDRRIIVTHIKGQKVVCPDNGLITWAWRRLGPGAVHELTWRPASSSSTFHGRDVMAPAAGMLAAGTPVDRIARPIDNPVLLDLAPADPRSGVARVIHIDAFGNATTNMDGAAVKASASPTFRAGGRNVGGLRNTYENVPPGQPLALIGSSGLLEVAVREGSAGELLGLRVGDAIFIE